MADIPQWRLVGDYFDVCSCDIPCPCEFAQPPTNNHCEGVLAYHIGEGNYGDVRLDGLNVLGPVRDFEISGAGKSELEDMVKPLLARPGLRRAKGSAGRLEKRGPFAHRLELVFDDEA